MSVSKYQHFFIYALLLTLLTGCALKLPSNDGNLSQQEQQQALIKDKKYTQCKEQQLDLQQSKDALSAELGLAKKKLQQLEADRNQLKAKLDALTAIERSLHQRKQRQSLDL